MTTTLLVAAIAATLAAAFFFGGPLLAWSVAEVDRRLQRHSDREDWADRQESTARDLWSKHPERAIVGENFAHQAETVVYLQQDVNEAEAELEVADERHETTLTQVRDGKPVTPSYRAITFGGLVLWAVLLVAAVCLDVALFRSLRPNDGWTIPTLQGVLAAIAQTFAGALLWDAVKPRGLLPLDPRWYNRAAEFVAGALLLAGVAWYVLSVSPFRASNASVLAAQGLLFDARQSRPADPAAVEHATLLLDDAKRTLHATQVSDSRNTMLLVITDAGLAEFAVAGAELLMLDSARRKRDRAQRASTETRNELAAANEEFVAALANKVISHGHGPEVVHRGIALYNQTVTAPAPPPPAAHVPPQPQAQPVPAPADEPEDATTPSPAPTPAPGWPMPGSAPVPDQSAAAPADLALADVAPSVIHPAAQDETA